MRIAITIICTAIISAVGAWSMAAKPADASATPVDFKRDIQPLLQSRCMECHGAEKQKAGFRLTDRDWALRATDSGRPAIVPGDAAGSELIRRITTKDEDDRMPKKGDRLTAEQIDLLRRWIDQGAAWSDDGQASKHWAYIKPTRPALPAVKQANWPQNEIDYFILARLEKEGLKPSAPADRAKLIRRVYLDLIGLPPTIEQVDAFVNDESSNAYEKVVDRLLASDRFGERWARPWLDLARYADSNGFQADQLRDSWAYRDWVINALNADMPFDQFTIEQIAGDLLPNATVDQKIATGFHRTPTCNVEAGVHPEENRVNQVVDRVNTTGMVWLGTTIECAQCHNHKYDPFTQAEYYQLFAFFNNTPLEVENPSGRGVSFDFWGPKMDLPLPPDEQAQRDRLEARLAELKHQLEAASQKAGQDQQAWERRMIAALKDPPTWRVLEIASFDSTGGEDVRILEDQSVLLGGRIPGTATYTVTVNTKLTNINAIKVEALTHDSLPGKGPGRGDDARPNFILSELALLLGGPKGKRIELHSPEADYSQNNWNVAEAIDGDPKSGWAIGQKFHEPHWATFRTREPIGEVGGTTLTFVLDQNFGRGRTIGRLRLSALSGDTAAIDLPPEIAKILKKDKRTAKERRQLADHFVKSNPLVKKVQQQIASVQKQINRLAPPTTLVMVEMDEPRQTNIMRRGEYLNPGPQVDYGTPAVLHAMDADLPRNRLGLAQWLVDQDNPLVGRVTVNRWWAWIMGQGIVKSLEDFGVQAEPPTHPQLLDWLAVEFVESGWSTKHMLKLIVMSATYQQTSKVTPQLLAADPGNELYARGPRVRMSAEMIRDNALAVSGLLSTKMAGPPVMPYQPPGIWRQVGRNEPKWVESPGEDRYRRGVYVVWRRAAPYPSFVNFDAPDRSACVVQRSRTNTPLQALTLLNDPAYVEMAVALAYRIMTDRPDLSVRDRAAYGLRLCLARQPRRAEIDQLEKVFVQELARFESNPAAARSLIEGVEGYKAPADVNKNELAAWFYVANILLNLDEMITRG